jgi:hypothetical protein
MPKARKKSLAEKQLEQSKRFKEAAEKAGADKSGREFERAFKKIVRSTQRKDGDKRAT